MQQDITIRLNERRVFVEVGEPVQYRKEVSPQVFVDLFADMFYEEEETDEYEVRETPVYLDQETPILPRNTLCYKGHSEVSRYAIAILAPAAVRPLQYFDKTFQRIPYPDLVFFFKVNNGGHVATSRVYAVENCMISKDTNLYGYPFSNVLSFSGDICRGENYLEKTQGPKSLEGLPYLFFSASNNNDRYSGEKPLYDLLKELDGQPVFPKELLGSPVMTFGQAWDQIN